MLTMRVLAEPVRRRLLDELCLADQTVGELVERLRLSQPAVSKHLRVMKDAGLVNVRAEGQWRIYSVRAEGLRELHQWLEPYRLIWSSRLDSLEDYLERMEDR